MNTISVIHMKRAEELAVSHFGLETAWLMEHAGRAVARVARELIGIRGKTISVLVGKGHNGGDALVAARLLSAWGAKLNLILPFHPDHFAQLTKDHYGTATSLHQNRLTAVDNLQWDMALRQSHLIIDGVFGTGLSKAPDGLAADLIERANASGKKILAIDCPSGLDAQTGQAPGACINADVTVALGAMKLGLSEKSCGKLWLADIGLPHEVWELMGIQMEHHFLKTDLVKL